MKRYEDMGPCILTLTLDKGEQVALCLVYFTSSKKKKKIYFGTHWIGDWVGPKAGLNAERNTLPPAEN
jgi:hypothetical protein